ncbi:unnamed protein product [Cladocopium goreaui]|uniref:HEAT repeat-containing protein 1 n=1 Tax=Cladocopium goreaui TaxID=2562237 RepID=A0A9P1G734_9DINO|nr:unnamed protein product [Cladocopium goreaui]
MAGVKNEEIASADEVQRRWGELTRELEIAVSMGNTERLQTALSNTDNSGISKEQLKPARNLLGAFQRSDAAFLELDEAIDSCDAEIIHGNNNVSDSVEEDYDRITDLVWDPEALLQRAARALCPPLPTLLSTFQSEKATEMFCPPGPGGLLAGSAGEPVARALRGPFGQTDLEALEHLALAWAHLLELCGARPVLHDLVKSLYDTFLQLAALVGKPSQGEIEAEAQLLGRVPMPDTLLATAQRLRILAKAYDVSLCDVEGFVSTALSMVEGVQTGTVEPELTVTLLEILALISVRHAGQRAQQPKIYWNLPLGREVATGFLTKDEDHRLKSAAFGVALCTLSAWWNAAHFGKTEEVPGDGACDVLDTEVKPWFCQLPDALQDALANHLGTLLAEVRDQWRKWLQDRPEVNCQI